MKTDRFSWAYRPRSFLFSGAAVLFTGLAFATNSIGPPLTPGGFPVYVQDVSPQANEAAAAVDAFAAAMKAMDLELMAQALSPEVVILEGGKSERSRDEYLGHHAVADAMFMQSAQVINRYRKARASDNFAWVATESIIEISKDGEQKKLHSTETMLLEKSDSGWKIVHIHWSSRPMVAS